MERKILKDFTGGINRAVDAIKMKDNEFYEFINLIVYKLGSLGNAIKRYAVENWHTSGNTNASPITQLFQYISNSKTVNFNRLIFKTSDNKL